MSINGDLAEQFFAAVAAADADALSALCTPNVSVSQNGAPPMGMTELVALLSAAKSVVRDNRYENVRRSDTEDGFVEEHDFVGVLPDGTAVQIPGCVVATVHDGKIAEMREYFDGAAFAPIVEALGA